MKTLTIVFLTLVLIAPGAVLASPLDDRPVAPWHSAISWIIAILDGLSGADSYVDPVDARSPESEGLPNMDGYTSSAGPAVPSEVAPAAPQNPENPEEPQPLPAVGGFIDPGG